MDELFGTSDFYSKNLNKLGCEARDIIFNDLLLQQSWMREKGLGSSICPLYKNDLFFKALGRFNKIPWDYKTPYKFLKAQIDYYRPDVLYIQDLSMDGKFISDIRRSVKFVIGQIAAPLPRTLDLKGYDLILTCLPYYVELFRNMGVNSEYFRIAFEHSVLGKIGMRERTLNATFVGGITKAHASGTQMLEKLAANAAVDFYGYGASVLPKESAIRKRHCGEAWGKDMYGILCQSKVTVNRHIDIARNYAANMRLYEATGCGAMLITDMKDNLGELFEVGKEVVAYRDVDELIDLVHYYSSHDKERDAIAQAGQRRTLTEHTYFNRMQELLEIIPKYIK